MPDFMQYENEPPLNEDEEEALSQFGQFYSSTADFEFLARLRAGQVRKKDREAWFRANETRKVAAIAQGILAAVYGEDPP